MSRTLALKTSSILICFIILAAAAFTVFAEESTPSTNVRKPTSLQKINVRKDTVDSKLEALRVKQASREANLKAKLETFKDKRKAEVAERVNTNLNKINQNQTRQMLRHIDTMTEILNKLEARVNKKTPDIKDSVAAKNAITDARNTIATTSAAVQAQAEKDYTITVSSESRVRIDAKTQRDKLHTDLLALRKMVIDTKQSVGSAIRVAKSGPKEATSSGNQ